MLRTRLRHSIHKTIKPFAASQGRSIHTSNTNQASPGLALAPTPQELHGYIYDSKNVKPHTFRKSLQRAALDQKSSENTAATVATHQDINHAAIPAILTLDQPTTHTLAAYHRGDLFIRTPYWQKIGRWKDVGEATFLSHRWNVKNDVTGEAQLYKFMKEEVPQVLPHNPEYEHIRTQEELLEDVYLGIKRAPMSIRMTPHMLASINWKNPLQDPIFRQFVPTSSRYLPDHPKVELDSLHEQDDSPVKGLVHRYTDKCLFLAVSHCPTYCTYCTRSYAIGANTETVEKDPLKATLRRWEPMFQYIENTPIIQDVVVSGGDCYSLQPHQLELIGNRLLSLPNVRRFRIATKGLCVSPNRTLDPEDDWTNVLIKISNEGKKRGKQVALHTHFNTAKEISWVTREAAQKLFAAGVTVRNQSVLLRGVNDTVESMSALIRELSDNNITPMYVYNCDLVKGVESLRTPLSTILHLEQHIRGTIAGHQTPQFIVDLPGGGGKRLAASYETYDRKTGRSTFVAPAVHGEGKEGKAYEYWDPLHSLADGGRAVFDVVQKI